MPHKMVSAVKMKCLEGKTSALKSGTGQHALTGLSHNVERSADEWNELKPKIK